MISVTQVLDYFTEPELLAWYKRVGFKSAEATSQEALRVGKVVDDLIQQDLRGTPLVIPETDEPVRNCLRAWILFNLDHPMLRFRITGIQTALSDGELIGHPDFEITEDSRYGIVDVKTSKSIQPKHWTQVAEYLSLKERQMEAGERVGKSGFAGVLRLDKQTAGYEYRELTVRSDILYEAGVFHAYLTAYQHAQTLREVFRRQLEQEALDVA